VDFVEKPLSLARLLMIVERALRMPVDSGPVAGAHSVPSAPPPEIVGSSEYVKSLREQATRIAENDAPVLISGEAGSGRGVLARHIHALSDRRDGPFVSLRADSISEKGAATELYGSEYAGVVNPGLLEQAAGGSLYLSDIGSLRDNAQSLLLAVLETRQFTRVGGSQPLSLDLRLISSTAEHLRERAAAGLFREELYYRIAVLPLQTLGLREHLQDIPALLEFYVNWFVEQEKLSYRHFNVAAQNRLRNHVWPGNIRELKNLVQRLMILGSGSEVGVDEVEQALSSGDGVVSASGGGMMPVSLNLPLREARAEFERLYLRAQLEAVDGSIVELARRVGMERTHLYRKLRTLGIDASRSRN
jgi:DNA-binding NtrC family response regulator